MIPSSTDSDHMPSFVAAVPSISFTFRNANIPSYEERSDSLDASKTPETSTTVSLCSVFNATSPANHLPAELVAKILMSDERKYWWEVLPLTHICRHWRRVAIGTPQLWAQTAQLATAIVNWTGGRPCWRPSSLLPMLLDRSMPCLLRFDLPEASCLNLLVQQDAVLNPHFSRLTHLSVKVTNGDDVATVLGIVHSHIPNIESLQMTEANHRSGPPISLNELPYWDDAELPHLRSLTIPGLCFARAIAVASLKNLVLSDRPRSHEIFLAALDRCSLALESLTLHQWVHPDQANDASASQITRVVPLPNLRHLEIQLHWKSTDTPPLTLLFAGLSISPRTTVNIDWSCNQENTRELLQEHLSRLQFDAVSLRLSEPPQKAGVQCYIGNTEYLRVRALQDFAARSSDPQSFVTKFLEEHRYPTATKLAVDLEDISQDDDLLRQFVDAFPNLRRLDLLGDTAGCAKLVMAKAFLDLPRTPVYPAAAQGTGSFKTLGYVCEVWEDEKVGNPIGFVDVLRAQLDALEALLAESAAAGGSRLHRLELCVGYASLQSHPQPEAYPHVNGVAASRELTAYVSSTYLPRFSRLVDEVVFIGDVNRQGISGYRILTGGARRAVGSKRLHGSRGGMTRGRLTRKGW